MFNEASRKVIVFRRLLNQCNLIAFNSLELENTEILLDG